MFHHLAGDTCKVNGSVVFRFTMVAFLLNWCYIGMSPIIRHSAKLQRLLEYVAKGVCLNMLQRGSATASAVSFSVRALMPSGPVALFIFSSLRSFRNPFRSIFRSSILITEWFALGAALSIGENTDWNYNNK